MANNEDMATFIESKKSEREAKRKKFEAKRVLEGKDEL